MLRTAPDLGFEPVVDVNDGRETIRMEANLAQLQSCMYQYSRAIYRSIKDLIDPYVDRPTRLEYLRAVLCECEETMTRLAAEPHYLARPEELEDRIDRVRRQLDATGQGTPQLDQDDLPDNQIVLGKNVAENVGAQTSGRERCHEDVRVEEHPHDTSRNTSSSVR